MADDPREIYRRLDKSIRANKRQAKKLQDALGEETWAKYEAIGEAPDDRFIKSILEFVLSFPDISSFRGHLDDKQAAIVDELDEVVRAHLDEAIRNASLD